ncbi:MAG: hydrogenase maturation nickel metallochaperone HypA [Synechococcaceae cyanobacterium]|nr:hydrogenase maturation nickel metallochaperone HypA [Synechococcaceae cyanobacterium]
MQELRDQALAAAAAEGAERIVAIHLRVGELAGVELEALRFAFPLAMEDTIAAAAQLHMEWEPAIGHCEPCGRDFHAQQGLGDCPHCGALSRQLLSGRDLRLVALEIE